MILLEGITPEVWADACEATGLWKRGQRCGYCPERCSSTGHVEHRIPVPDATPDVLWKMLNALIDLNYGFQWHLNATFNLTVPVRACDSEQIVFTDDDGSFPTAVIRAAASLKAEK